jgi:hypothetical protein
MSTTTKEFKLEDFIESLVKIDEVEAGAFGHYPFQLVSQKADGKLTVTALCLGGDVMKVYKTSRTLIEDGAVKLFLSVDFPAHLDMDQDFIAVFAYENDQARCFAIPYDPTSGETFPHKTGQATENLTKVFNKFVLNR